jgi:hypothetical protein
VNGKHVYQIGIPFSCGFRGIAEDAGRTSRTLVNLITPTSYDANTRTPEYKTFLVKVEKREHFGYENAGVYDPPGVGGTGVIYVLHDVTRPEQYGGLPKDPRVPAAVGLWKGPLKWLGSLVMVGGLIGMIAHFFLFGPKPDPGDEESHTEKPND